MSERISKVEIEKLVNKSLVIKLTNRIVWIDWAKSLCMFLVIMGHCHIHPSQSFIIQIIYSFHMQLFFFLSGTLCKRKFSYSSLKRDIKFIVFPYFTYGIIYMLWGMLCSRSFSIDNSLHFLKLMILGNDCSIGPIWFLPALFYCKQLFLLIDLAKKRCTYLYYLAFLLSIIFSFFISLFKVNIPFFLDSALMGLPFFILGNIFFKNLLWFEKMKNSIRISLSLVLLLFSIVFSYYNGFVAVADCVIGNSIILYYLNSITAILSVTFFCMELNRFSCYYVTLTSYGSIVILGLHGIILSIFNYYLPLLLEVKTQTYSILLALLYSIITLFYCFILIIFIDKLCPHIFGLKGQKK